MRLTQLPKLNQTQIKTLAGLFVESGKWLLLSIVFGTVFSNQSQVKDEDIRTALTVAIIAISYGIWLLKEVKDK